MFWVGALNVETQTRSGRWEEEIGAPHPDLRACVIIPARNEKGSIARCLEALAQQCDLSGAPLPATSYEIILLLNNCSDETGLVARKVHQRYPRLRLHIAEIEYGAAEAHVGKARQALFEAAFRRFQGLQRPAGLILTMDADSRSALDWIAQNEAEIGRGVDAVGGRILLEASDLAALPPGVRKFFLLDIGYRRALEEMQELYAPTPHDPFPRHHQNFGSSLAVTAEAYGRAGGMPLRIFREDVALYQAILDSGGRFRHSEKVRVHTSGRMIGRAKGGMADAIGWWNEKVEEAASVQVESAEAAEERFRTLGFWCLENPGCVPPAALTVTPDRPAPNEGADIRITLAALRQRLAFLRALPLSKRLGKPSAMPGNAPVAEAALEVLP